MPSLRARLVELVLPLLGIKRLFSQPDRLDARLARARRRKSPRPAAKWHRHFEIEESVFADFPVITMTPRGGARAGAPHILFLHGGGYVLDINALHWDMLARLCNDLGASASVPIYPLAPEAKAGRTLPAMRALYDALAERFGASRLAIMGDSAGAGMGLALAQGLAGDGAQMPGALVLFSPWLDATCSDEQQAAIERSDSMLAQAGLKACAARYAGDIPPADPRLSPLFGTLERLPPVAVFAGTHDILVVDARRFQEKLVAAGTDHLYREYDGMFHDWMLFPIPEGRQALAETARFLESRNFGEG